MRTDVQGYKCIYYRFIWLDGHAILIWLRNGCMLYKGIQYVHVNALVGMHITFRYAHIRIVAMNLIYMQ